MTASRPRARLRRLARAPLCALALLATAACATRPAPSAAPTPSPTPAAYRPSAEQRAFADTVERRTFDWFWETTNPRNGLTPDRWPTKSFSSVAAVGFALTAYPVGVERGWVTRAQARERVLTTLRFFWNAPQGPQVDGMTGHNGFFYHFLDMETGRRFEHVELSTIDSALLLAGVLTCREFFDGPEAGEVEVRALADSLYRRADWNWARDGKSLVSMGWHPEAVAGPNERGFIPTTWHGYMESMLLYVLALGSPTHPLPDGTWAEWAKTYQWSTFQGQTFIQFAPLFGHQYSHVWVDFRGIQDPFMKAHGIDYFENSRRATLSQRSYAIANPGAWREYGPEIWGLTAGDGPLDSTFVVAGRAREFHTYWARGAGGDEINDDGTIGPTAAGGSVPFAPEVALPALMEMRRRYGEPVFGRYGFVDAFNPTLREAGPRFTQGRLVPGLGWFDTDYLGIDQGPILAMLENERSDLVWRMMRKSPYIVRGLCRAGFQGGWLNGKC